MVNDAEIREGFVEWYKRLPECSLPPFSEDTWGAAVKFAESRTDKLEEENKRLRIALEEVKRINMVFLSDTRDEESPDWAIDRIIAEALKENPHD